MNINLLFSPINCTEACKVTQTRNYETLTSDIWKIVKTDNQLINSCNGSHVRQSLHCGISVRKFIWKIAFIKLKILPIDTDRCRYRYIDTYISLKSKDKYSNFLFFSILYYKTYCQDIWIKNTPLTPAVQCCC